MTARVASLLAFIFGTALQAGPLLAADAAPRVAHVGMLYAADLPEHDRHQIEAFITGLRAAGYVEGRNLVLERWVLSGRAHDRGGLAAGFRDGARELLRHKVDAIFAPTTAAAYGASLATRTTPIVFSTVLDPLQSHLVTSYARPDRNLTGIAVTSGAFQAKRLEILKEAFPRLRRVGVLYDETQREVCGLELTELKQAADQLGITLRNVPVESLSDLEPAFSRMKQAKVEAILIPYTLALPASMKSVVRLAIANRLPTLHEIPDFADVGGLLSYGPSFGNAYGRAGYYVAKILEGARPDQLPVEMPQKFELVVNLKTARLMNIELPRSLLMRADRVVE